MNMNPMQYDVNEVYRREMEQQAAKQRMANDVMQSRQPNRSVQNMVEHVARRVAMVWMPHQQEAIPARFEPKASA